MALFNEELAAGMDRFGENAVSGNVRAQRNLLFNGNFDFWQRGTSFAGSASGLYCADRWRAWMLSSGTAWTASQQSASGVSGGGFALRMQRNSGSAVTLVAGVSQTLANVDALPLVGKYISVSFYARAGANYSSSGSALGVELIYGTGTNQQGLPGSLTGQTVITTTAVTLTTSWQRFTLKFGQVATSATQVQFDFFFTPVGTASTNDYFEVAQVMLSAGSRPAPFEYYAGSYEAELNACERFYEKSFALATTPAQNVNASPYYLMQAAGASTANAFPVNFRVKKFQNPTVTIYSPNNASDQVWNNNVSLATTGASPAGAGVTGFYVSGATTPAGSAAGNLCSVHYTADAEL